MPVCLAAEARTFITGLALGAAERAFQIPEIDGVSFNTEVPLILVRDRNRVMALAPACPHEHAAVRWAGQADRFECTKHNSQYRRDGSFISGRATRPLDRFPIRRDAGQVVVTIDRAVRADLDGAGWAAAVVNL